MATHSSNFTQTTVGRQDGDQSMPQTYPGWPRLLGEAFAAAWWFLLLTVMPWIVAAFW